MNLLFKKHSKYTESKFCFSRTISLLVVLNLQRYHMSHTAPRAISLENHMTKKSPVWGPYTSSDRGRKTRTVLREKGVRNEVNAAMNAFSLCEKKLKTQRSYDKMRIDWVGSGRTWRYLVLKQDARTSLRYSRSVRPDLEPNIFLSVPPTQSIRTYNSRRNTNLKNFTFRISWLADIYESINLCYNLGIFEAKL